MVFSQDCLTEFAQFSCADAFRKGIQHHPPPSPSRHWPHQINLPRRLWVIAEVLGLFSEHFRIRLYHFLGHMHFAGKFALHRRRGIRVIRLRSPSGFAFLAFPLEILRAFGHIVNARASGFAILAFSLEILRALGHIVNARAPLNLAKSGESIGRAGRGANVCRLRRIGGEMHA